MLKEYRFRRMHRKMQMRNESGSLRAVAAVIVMQVAVIFSSIMAPSKAVADEHSPAELLFGVRVGDSTDKVLAQQGWYDCGNNNSKSRLCFDRVTTLGETGRFSVDFINGKAFAAELVIPSASAMSRMIDRLPNWGTGDQTLVSIRTKNTYIDIIKAVHDLGDKEAMNRFSRYLARDARHQLSSITLVPGAPPFEQRYTSELEYLDNLPRERIFISLSIFGSPLDITVLRIHPSLSAKKEIFSEFCDARCEHWSVPPPPESKPSFLDRIIRFVK